jgi:hypothetical protein
LPPFATDPGRLQRKLIPNIDRFGCLIPEHWMTPVLLIYIAALAGTALTGHAARPTLLLTLTFTFIALLPVAHLLLVDATGLGASRFYLASAGFAMFLAAAIEGLGPRAQIAAAIAVIAFQVSVLQHNLAIWSQVAALVDRTCVGATRGAIVQASQFPAQIDGVPFLRNGFEACVAFHQARGPTTRRR